jgi:hypothetical protein
MVVVSINVLDHVREPSLRVGLLPVLSNLSKTGSSLTVREGSDTNHNFKVDSR